MTAALLLPTEAAGRYNHCTEPNMSLSVDAFFINKEEKQHEHASIHFVTTVVTESLPCKTHVRQTFPSTRMVHIHISQLLW